MIILLILYTLGVTISYSLYRNYGENTDDSIVMAGLWPIMAPIYFLVPAYWKLGEYIANIITKEGILNMWDNRMLPWLKKQHFTSSVTLPSSKI